MPILIELSSLLLVATLVSLVLKVLKQPLIVGYILTGIIAGPMFLNLVHSEDTLEVFSKIGITILLYIIGLHLNPQVIKEVGWVALVTGVGQIVLTSTVGFLLSTLLGFGVTEAIFISLALTFSSTIIILKLLSDKGDLNKLYGKVATGFLLVQDIVASMILLGVSVSASDMQTSALNFALLTAGKVFGLFAIIGLLSWLVLPKLVSYLAESQEQLFVFSLAWGLGFAALFDQTGLSIEIGALVAGVALSTSVFASEISSRLRPIRDFFIVIFFVLLGAEIILSNIVALLLPALGLSLFVLIGNPLIVFFIMNLLGYHKRTSFLAGLTVAQVSEFSLILMTLGFDLGFVESKATALVTLIGIITITASSYMILYSRQLYELLLPLISKLEIKKNSVKRAYNKDKVDVILFGHGRVGMDYIKAFKKLGIKFLVVDYDPATVSSLIEDGVHAIYGDAEDVEFLSELPISSTRMIITTITDFNTDLLLVREIKSANPRTIVITKSSQIRQAKKLYKAGASYVIMPHYLGAQYAMRLIAKRGLKILEYKKAKKRHLAYLDKRESNT